MLLLQQAGGSLGLPVGATGQKLYYPGNQGGTNYNNGIDLANTLLTGSTADKKIVIFVTDATVVLQLIFQIQMILQMLLNVLQYLLCK